MARIFIDGFEAGQDDLWNAESSANVVSSAGLDMDGSYCLDINNITEYIEKNITADDEMYFAFLYRATSDPNGKGILSVWNGSTVLISIARNGTAQVIQVLSGTGYAVLATGSKSLAINTTHLIEVRVKIADSGGRIEVKVDGISDIDFTGDTKPDANTQFDKVRLGYTENLATYSYAYFDNFIMDDAAWIGDTNIQAIVPTAAGNSTGWTPSAGANFECVDERPASDVDYVSINANDVSDTYVTGDMAGTIDSVKCVQIQSRTRSEGAPTPTNLKLVARSGATDYLSGNKAVLAAEKALYNLWETNPADSAAWAESDVNALQIGIKSAA
jgi:hypothetical protein